MFYKRNYTTKLIFHNRNIGTWIQPSPPSDSGKLANIAAIRNCKTFIYIRIFVNEMLLERWMNYIYNRVLVLSERITKFQSKGTNAKMWTITILIVTLITKHIHKTYISIFFYSFVAREQSSNLGWLVNNEREWNLWVASPCFQIGV